MFSANLDLRRLIYANKRFPFKASYNSKIEKSYIPDFIHTIVSSRTKDKPRKFKTKLEDDKQKSYLFFPNLPFLYKKRTLVI